MENFLYLFWRTAVSFNHQQTHTQARAHPPTHMHTGHAHWRLAGLPKQFPPQQRLLRPLGLIKAMPRKQSHRQRFTMMRLVRVGGERWLQNKSHNLECQRRNDYSVNNVDTDNIVTSYPNPTAEIFFFSDLVIRGFFFSPSQNPSS